MKISLSGAQCTGKTTLINQIENDTEFLKEFVIIKEVVRTIKKKEGAKFEFNKSNDFDSQEMILAEHHRNTLKYDNFITDRGSLDAFAYATKNYLDGKFTFREWKLFESCFNNTQHRYDIVFYLPIDIIPMEDDTVRDTDTTYQTEIHNIFMWIIAEYNVSVIILNDPLDERFDVLKGILTHQCLDDSCKH